ncbi:predicted protein [Streptomyces viridochromogenes DSM 40736]|uniref:Predicted protein n=1 Tax=Streptomyces viridochromogenes (strain DSM 40736 / JCM 4977 / BCRC 1201 / Tue 494) TaxID=591159 RepID=D9XGN2_STRVT|nr:hypothetical protein [Streptomyces viridochromogenes]EFL30653.1 predicted protein [Streptomyces viridochromogenes DSM 40736]
MSLPSSSDGSRWPGTPVADLLDRGTAPLGPTAAQDRPLAGEIVRAAELARARHLPASVTGPGPHRDAGAGPDDIRTEADAAAVV